MKMLLIVVQEQQSSSSRSPVLCADVNVAGAFDDDMLLIVFFKRSWEENWCEGREKLIECQGELLR